MSCNTENMNNSENLYTVMVYTTPMSFPLNFSVHSWVEIVKNKVIERYDFWAYPGLKTAADNHGYLYKNIFPDHLGTTFSPFADIHALQGRQVGTILFEISGDENSIAYKLYAKIHTQAFLYPLYDTYNMIFGSNCNTYTQWLLHLVPEAGLSLPWYAWGKGVNVKALEST